MKEAFNYLCLFTAFKYTGFSLTICITGFSLCGLKFCSC